MAEPRRVSSPSSPSSRPRAALGALLLGLALNVLALLRGARLSPADLMLGGTVLLAGVALLVLIELSRRTGR